MRRLFLSLIFFCAHLAYAQPLPPCHNKTVVIAHRGNHMAAPENTVQAIHDAIAAGADYVEVDLRTTKDGVLVILHDATVDRTTNGTGKISELTWQHVSALRAIDRAHPAFGQHAIPTFDDVLQACRKKINLYLDFKDADVAATWKALTAADMQRSVVVYANSEKQFLEWRRIAPAVPLMVSLPDSVRDVPSLEVFLRKVDARVLDGDHDAYTPAMIAAATQWQRAVWVDIQRPEENAAYWEPICRTGFHGLQTDHPAELILFLKQKGIR